MRIRKSTARSVFGLMFGGFGFLVFFQIGFLFFSGGYFFDETVIVTAIVLPQFFTNLLAFVLYPRSKVRTGIELDFFLFGCIVIPVFYTLMILVLLYMGAANFGFASFSQIVGSIGLVQAVVGSLLLVVSSRLA